MNYCVLPWNHRPPSIRVVTPPVAEPLSLSEAKDQIRVDQDFTDEDTYISTLITAAREYCEGRKNYALVEQTLDYWIDQFPCSGIAIELPRATPLASIVSVLYTDSDGTETEWDASNYRAVSGRTPGLLAPNYGVEYPSFIPQNGDAVKIRYVAGPPANSPAIPIPARYKLAMGLLVGHWYLNREATIIGFQHGEKMAIAVDDLLGIDQRIY